MASVATDVGLAGSPYGDEQTKICPDCAETILAAARVCKHCGYRFDATPRRHLRADRLAALGVPSGPLRARLAAGEAVVLPDGRQIEPDAVQGPPAAGISLAVVGDTEEVASLVGPIGGADALVIEATFLEADAALAAERGHLTAAQAGRLAAAAQVGALYLTHISGRYDPADIAAEAARFFPNVSVANDFDRMSVAASLRGVARNPRHSSST